MNKDYNFIVKLTTSCPGNCKCCTSRQANFKDKNEGNKVFDIEVFRKICKNIKKLNGSYICLSGGEPTIVKNIDEYIEIAHSFGLATRINTNGWNITEENVERWLKKGLDQIVISIYGIDEESIIKTRGSKYIFKRSMNALDILKKLRKKYKFVFIIQTIIMKDTYKQLPDILKLAIDCNATMVWPSYLEDAVNLPDLRLSSEEIKEFTNNIIPKMKKIIDSSEYNDRIKKQLTNSLNQYYKNDISEYIYHNENENCHWAGSHFTFYPNGTIDPCPGHEYFKSDSQNKLNYKDIDEFMQPINLEKMKKVCFEYCKYCPQGKHISLSFVDNTFHEHNRREEL